MFSRSLRRGHSYFKFMFKDDPKNSMNVGEKHLTMILHNLIKSKGNSSKS